LFIIFAYVARALAGGIALEDRARKALVLGSPYVARANGEFPIYYGRFGTSIEEVFIEGLSLKNEIGESRFKEMPTGAMGLYTYNKRLAQGLRQFMCGCRKFALQHNTRDDIVALTTDASKTSGITYIMDADKEDVEKMLD
jgi:hypothetical protein